MKYLLAAVVMMFGSMSVLGCFVGPSRSGKPMTRERLTKELEVYSAVFVGKVAGFEYRPGDPRKAYANELDGPEDLPRLPAKRDARWVEFTVEKWWKLPLGPTTFLITDQWRVPDGGIIFSSCDYEWKTGEKYLVYAKGPQHLLTANFQSWTIPLSDAGEDLKILGEGQKPITFAGDLK